MCPGRIQVRARDPWSPGAASTCLGFAVVPFYRVFFGWEGSPTKIDDNKKGTLILTSLLEDLDAINHPQRDLTPLACRTSL